MTTNHRTGPVPGRIVSDIEVSLVGGRSWRLSEQKPQRFTLIDFYRGRHCPRCHLHLLDLRQKLPRLKERGIEVIAISMDEEDRATEAVSHWGLENVNVGYGLEVAAARGLGLYLSTAIGSHEPRQFCEPAMLLIRPDQTLYAAQYSTMPFARFHYADLLEGLDVVIARAYPARGGD